MSSKKTKLLESAQKNLLKGQHDRAADEYRQIIQLDPSDIRHRQKLAEILTKANQKEEAIKEYTFLAKYYVDSIHYLKAIAVYKQIQKLDPTNPEISLILASLNEKQGLIGNANAEYASAVQIYELNGENRKALKVLESMLTLDPSNSAVRIRIAEKYFTTGSEEKSFFEFESLLRDLKERNDENGFRLIAERATNLFGDKAEELISKISVEMTDNELSVEICSLTSPENFSTDADNLQEDLPAIISNTTLFANNYLPTAEPVLIREEVNEVIENILPITDNNQLPEYIDDEWEEVLDLDTLCTELPLNGAHSSSQVVNKEMHAENRQDLDKQDLDELDLDELELDELELDELELDELELDELELDELELDELELDELGLDELELDELELEINESASPSELSTFSNARPSKAEETFDLGQELSLFADEIDFDLFRIDANGASFDITSNSGLKKGELDNEDAESHYSLGLAYKEMGLFDEAIAEFIVASHSSKRQVDCLILQGVCLRETGSLNKAIEIFSETLRDKSMTEDESLGLQYELALCHEASGEHERARKLFADISMVRPSFSDVATHLNNLRA